MDCVVGVIFWCIINALVGGLIGSSKGEAGTGVILSLLLGPIGWLITALLPGNRRRCPFCAESMRPEAIVCPHCHRDVPAPPPATESEPPRTPIPPMSRTAKIIWSSIAVLLIGGLVAGALLLPQLNKPLELAAEASPTPTPKPLRFGRSFKITKNVRVTPTLVIPAGSEATVIADEGATVEIRFGGGRYSVPKNVTDLP